MPGWEVFSLAKICHIVGAGPFCPWGPQPQPGDLLIAADGGYAHLSRWGLMPDLVVGDFDSGPKPAHPQVISLPREKDVTDTWAAAQLGRERGYSVFYYLRGLRRPAGSHLGKHPAPLPYGGCRGTGLFGGRPGGRYRRGQGPLLPAAHAPGPGLHICPGRRSHRRHFVWLPLSPIGSLPLLPYAPGGQQRSRRPRPLGTGAGWTLGHPISPPWAHRLELPIPSLVIFAGLSSICCISSLDFPSGKPYPNEYIIGLAGGTALG